MESYFQMTFTETYMGHFWGGVLTVSEKFSCFRTVAEQTTRTFLKLFLTYS